MYRSSFFKIVGVVSVLNIIAMGFGFLREITIGYIYGTSYQADSIITAFTIPDFLYVVIGGSINTAFITTYSKLDSLKKRPFAQTVYTILLLISFMVTTVFLLFPKFWMTMFFGGMSSEALSLTTKLFMVTAPATFFLIIAMLLSGLHNVYAHYRLTTFAALLFNGVYVGIGLLLTPVFSVYSYPIGATLGAVAMFVILAKQGDKSVIVPLQLNLAKMPELKKLLMLALPIIIGGATMHFYLIIQRIFAAGLNEGTISAMNYTSKITQVPRSIMMASVTTVVFPMLAKAAGNGDFTRISTAYKQGFRALVLLLVPVSIFLFVYAKEIVVAIFQYGHFGPDSTTLTYPLLQMFSISIFSLALNTYITRFYYALEKTLIPNFFNFISIFCVNISVILLLIDRMGAIAIPLATAISAIFNMFLLIIFAKIKLSLVVSNWPTLIKLILFVIMTIGVILMINLLPIETMLLKLLGGGLVMGLLICFGFKLIK